MEYSEAHGFCTVGLFDKLGFIGLWSDGRGGNTIHPHPPPAAELVGTFPRGDGKA